MKLLSAIFCVQLYILLHQGGEAITVYDCLDDNATHRIIDLIEPVECANPQDDFNTPILTPVAVLVSDEDYPITAIQCLVRVTTKVTRCGYDGLTYMSMYTRWENVLALTPEQCTEAAAGEGILVMDKLFPTTANMDKTYTYFSRGVVDNTGYCTYVEDFISGNTYFTKSVEEAVIHIVVRPIPGSINTAQEIVTFRNGLKAPINDHHLIDSHEGRIIWADSSPSCDETTSLVYNGTANIHWRKNSDDATGAIVMIADKETNQYAGLAVKDPKDLCGATCYSTHISSVTLCFHDPIRPLNITFKPHIDPRMTDVLTQMAYQHLGTNLRMAHRFETVQTDLCKVERKLMQSKLQAVSGAHNPYALLDLFGRGHVVMAAGSAAYVTKCVPKEGLRRSFTNCTKEILVMVDDVLRFADPFTWTLRDIPTVVPCSPLMPVRWKIMGKWFCSSPQIQECMAPDKIHLNSTTYTSIGDFTEGLGGGMYSDLQKSFQRRFQMAYDFHDAVTQGITNTMVDALEKGSRATILNREEMNYLMLTVGMSFIPFFSLVGNLWTSAVCALLFVFSIAALYAFGVRTYHLYQMRGCGWWLCAAFTNATTAVILAPANIASAAVRIALRQLYDDIPGEREARSLQQEEAPPAYEEGPHVPLAVQVNLERAILEAREQNQAVRHAPPGAGLNVNQDPPA